MKNKKRILHVLNSFNVGGMENGLANLVNLSNQEKFVHSICALRGIGEISKRITNPTCRLFDIKSNKTGSDRTVFIRLCKVIRNFQPHTIHIRHWGPLWDTIIATYLTGYKSKLVLSVHGKTYHEFCDSRWSTKLKRRVLTQFIDHIVTLNEYMKRSLINDEKIKKPITIIPNGVDTTKFAPAKNKKQIRKRFNIPNDIFLIGTVGRLSKIKDIPTIIHACNILLHKDINFKMFIIGDGQERGTIEKIIQQNNLSNFVKLLGTKQNVHEYLKCFDLYVQASLYEGFSNTILEAISSGLPAIVTDAGGNSSLIKNNINGYLFTPGDHISLSEKILKLYKNKSKWKEFASNARTFAKNKWSISKMITNYEEFYTTLNRSY